MLPKKHKIAPHNVVDVEYIRKNPDKDPDVYPTPTYGAHRLLDFWLWI